MASFTKIKWLRNLVRKDSETPAGKGIFAVNHVIPARTTVACYWGNVVDDTGLIQVRCMRYRALYFAAISPAVRYHVQ
jgi:hypothetical protein